MNRPAPRLDLSTSGGPRRSLEDYRGRPVMVSFLGPAGCMFCRAHVIRLIQAKDEIASLGGDVIFVAHHDPQLVLSRMMHDLELPYVLMIDPKREAYARWGLGQVTLKGRLMPSMYLEMFKEFLKVLTGRERMLVPVFGYKHLGGDFVVDREGRLAFEHRMKSFHDRANIADLLAAMRA